VSSFAVLLKKELLEQVRTSRLIVVAAIFLAVGLGSPLLAKYTPELLERMGGDIQIILPTPSAKDAVDQFLKNLGQTGPFAAILLAMSAVARERERGTAALVLTKPVTRPAFLAAKFVALLVTLGVGVLLGGIGAYFYTAVLFEKLPVAGFVAACLLVLLFIMVYGALTFLGSTVLGSTLPAAGIGFAAYVLLSILGAVPHVGRFTPDGLAGPARALALGQGASGLAVPLLANIAIIAFALALSWLAFRRQELGS
jgi:ABC-2 type transport system permease protein